MNKFAIEQVANTLISDNLIRANFSTCKIESVVYNLLIEDHSPVFIQAVTKRVKYINKKGRR